jgi:hypothetical protein
LWCGHLYSPKHLLLLTHIQRILEIFCMNNFLTQNMKALVMLWTYPAISPHGPNYWHLERMLGCEPSAQHIPACESTCGSLPTYQVLFPYYSIPEVFQTTCSPYILVGIGNAVKNTGRLFVASLSLRPTVMVGPDPMSG